VKLSRRDLIMLMVASLIIIGFLFYQFFYLPVNKEIKQIEQSNSELRQYAKADYNQTQLNSRELALKEDYQKLLLRMPEEQFLPELFSFYNQEANKAGITFLGNSFGVSDEQPTDDVLIEDSNSAKKNDAVLYQELPMELEVQGDYSQLKRFIFGLEQSNRLVSVRKVSITAEKNEQGTLSKTTDPQISGTKPPVKQPKASATYDAKNLVMKIEVSAYYNEKSLEGISGVSNLVAPPASLKENPFRD